MHNPTGNGQIFAEHPSSGRLQGVTLGLLTFTNQRPQAIMLAIGQQQRDKLRLGTRRANYLEKSPTEHARAPIAKG